MNLSERSLKAKEKFADANMSVANSIANAVFMGVLVFPLTAFVSSVVLGNEIFSSMKAPSWWQVFLFGILYFAPLSAAWYAKNVAMDLYDEIDRKTPKNSIGRTRKKFRSLRPAHVKPKRLTQRN